MAEHAAMICAFQQEGGPALPGLWHHLQAANNTMSHMA